MSPKWGMSVNFDLSCFDFHIMLCCGRRKFSSFCQQSLLCAPYCVVQASVVRKVDNAFHRINHYPVDSVVCFVFFNGQYEMQTEQ